MPARVILAASILIVALRSFNAGATTVGGHHQHKTALVRRDGVQLRARPADASRAVATLIEQQQVSVLKSQKGWDHVVVWDSIEGWLRRSDIVFAKPWKTTSTYHAPQIHHPIHAHGPRLLAARALAEAATPLSADPGEPPKAWITKGSTFPVRAWQQDAAGKIWYQDGAIWMPGNSIRFVRPVNTAQRNQAARLATGKGMWLTLGTFADTPAKTLVTAAIRNGITHLYLESAISPLGFHGRTTVGPLLDEAHKHHIAVIAWVYPYLYDIAADIALTRQVAAFETPAASRFDGIAEDLETNVDPWRVRAFSQITRAYLGNRFPLIGVTYAPQSFAGYPYVEIARSYDVIAPMDYWHQTKTPFGLEYGHMPYGFTYGYRYAWDSVRELRQIAGQVPIEPIGQAFDNFGRLEMGPFAPSQAETQGFLQGSKSAGAIGASFFQWMTATNPEWKAIHDFRYS